MNAPYPARTADVRIADDLDLAWEEPAAGPLAFAVETAASSADLLLSAAAMSGVRCEIVANCAALVARLADETPDMILLDVTTEGTNAVEVLHALSQRAYPGILQLMSQRGVSMVEPIRQLAQLHSLQVLPPLTKPLDAASLDRVLGNLRATVSQTRLPQIRLDEAIRNGWVQFWYQPKISLQDKTLVGVEAFVRLFHPNKGLMPPAVVLKNADDASLTALLNYALIETGAAGAKLAELGLNLNISINCTLKALQTLINTPFFADYTARMGRSPNWIFDIGEDDIAKNIPAIKSLAPLLRSGGARLAIDSFSGGVVPRLILEALPIAEIKLNPKFVAHCHTRSDHAEVCKALIGLAHDLNSAAVAIGVETARQSEALRRMGCNIGQGFLYGHPLPLDQLMMMIRQRSTRQQVRSPVRPTPVGA